MNTISNQKALKSRISASWPHDSSHYRFARQHKGPAFQPDQQPLLGLGEAVAWAAVFVFLLSFCILVLGLA